MKTEAELKQLRKQYRELKVEGNRLAESIACNWGNISKETMTGIVEELSQIADKLNKIYADMD